MSPRSEATRTADVWLTVWARAMAWAVCLQRSSGLETTAASGTTASRAAAFSAWVVPVSSSRTPGVRPASTPLTFADVRPCRTRITVATSARLAGPPGRTTVGAVIVDSAVYRKGERVPVSCGTNDYAALLDAAREPHDFVWVGLTEPSDEELTDVARAFGLHPLAVEDALNAHQRPKLDKYEDSLFLTLRTLWYIDEQDAVETGEINMFIGERYVVTVRHGKGSELHARRIDLEADHKVLGHGPSAVVYAVCDRVVDDYEEVAASLQEDVDEVESSVFSPSGPTTRCGSTRSSVRSPRCGGRSCRSRSRCASSPTAASRASTRRRRRTSPTSTTTWPGPPRRSTSSTPS